MATTDIIVQASILIGAVGTITGIITINLKKWLSKEMEDVKKTVREMDYNSCKNYLTDFLTEVKNEIPKSDVQVERACEVYKHYKEDLGGNSFIERDWNAYMQVKIGR